MFVRSKVENGRTYYQVVEGVRRGSVVRQRIVVSLGTTADPAVALDRMKQRLAEASSEYMRIMSRRSRRRLERQVRRIERLTSNIETLSSILDRKLIGVPRRLPRGGRT